MPPSVTTRMDLGDVVPGETRQAQDDKPRVTSLIHGIQTRQTGRSGEGLPEAGVGGTGHVSVTVHEVSGETRAPRTA